MNKSEIIVLYDWDQRINVQYPGMRREVSPQIVRHVDVSGAGQGSVIYSKLTETDADEAIREQVSYFKDLGQGFEWKLYDYDNPPDLKERLESHGFRVEESEAIMVLELESSPAMLWQPVSHDVQRIMDSEKLSDVLAVEKEVWDEDFSGLMQYLAEALSHHPDQMSVYVAYVNGHPASAAWIYFPANSQFASLWGGSTISRFRQQGLFSALLGVRAQEAKSRGVRYLTVDASPMSRPILEKFGFELIAYSYPCKWQANH